MGLTGNGFKARRDYTGLPADHQSLHLICIKALDHHQHL